MLVEDFYFRKPERKKPDVEEAKLEFEFCEHLAAKSCWERFLDKHKTGSYADRARKNLEALDNTETDPGERTPYDEAIKRSPKDPDNHYKRGVYYAQNGRHSDAIKDFEQTVRLNPKDAEAFNNLCWTRAIAGDLEAALRSCNDALRLRKDFADALDSRGFVNLKLGLLKSAIADYTAALRLNPKHSWALFGRGTAKLQSGDASGGDADVKAAKLVNPDIAQEFETYGVR